MKELSIIEKQGQLYADSREVAAFVGKRHDHLLRDIDRYVSVLKKNSGKFDGIEKSTAPKIGVSNFYVKSSYKDSTGRTLPSYLITRKGCDMIAHKLTGEKGILFTATYIERFYIYEEALRERQTRGWLMARTEGKKARRLETDAIKLFVEYAKAQGSKNPGKYYMNFTKLANQVVGIKPGDRDSGTTAQLLDLRMVENVIDRAILNEIAAREEYHRAFQNIKVKVLQVAALALSCGYGLPEKTA